ncbi:MAG: 7-cyano-7-deazaguanine synthase QueC [Panacagrimonas sp.]
MKSENKKKAVVLLSGGLDSATVLAIAVSEGFQVYTLSVAYGQRHSAELTAAAALSSRLGAVEHRLMHIDLHTLGGSALTDTTIPVPESITHGVPITYVPARNTLFLSLALGWAEVLDAHDVFIGVNAVDYSGYPDCRPAFIDAFQTLASLATRAGIEGHPLHVHAPLIHWSKAQIVKTGTELGVDFSTTVSCYQASDQGEACGRCDSCRLRAEGFAAAGIEDPTRYRPH